MKILIIRLPVAFCLILSLKLHTKMIFALKCVDCEGSDDCIGGKCEGDYCMKSTFHPKLMSANFGKPRQIKGCVNGDLLKKNIPSHCESYIEAETVVTTCFCNNEDFCNRKLEDAKKQEIPLNLCYCSGDAGGCNDVGECIGEYCTILRDTVTEKVISRGCINSSLPLVERRGAGACMQPPITAPIHEIKKGNNALNFEELATLESCLCSEDKCNRHPPKSEKDLNPKIMECKVDMTMNMGGLVVKVKKQLTCWAEYCYDIDLNNSHPESSILEYKVKGCMTFGPKAKLAEELNPTGCMTFGSANFQLTACYRTDTAATLPPYEKEEKERPVKDQGSDKTGGKVPARKEPEKELKSRPATNFPMPKEPEEILFPNKEDDPMNPEPEEVDDKETNTAIVAVFVVIMIIIVLAGVVWKFEIHKKLFRARYESVAG